MSRKHFQIFADQIKWIDDPVKRKEMAILVAGCCKQCNSNFDYSKFYRACGVEE